MYDTGRVQYELRRLSFFYTHFYYLLSNNVIIHLKTNVHARRFLMRDAKSMDVGVFKEVSSGVYGIAVSLPDGKFLVAILMDGSSCVALGYGVTEKKARKAALASMSSILEAEAPREDVIKAAWEGKAFRC
jgi:hypothetical protein